MKITPLIGRRIRIGSRIHVNLYTSLRHENYKDLMKPSKKQRLYPINNLEVNIVVSKAICHYHRFNSVSTIADDRLHFPVEQVRELGGIPVF